MPDTQAAWQPPKHDFDAFVLLTDFEDTVMIDFDRARLQLDRSDHLRLTRARMARLTTVSGVAWITVDRDAGDNVVRAGETFVVPSDRTVVVGPLFSSLTLDVRGSPDAMPCVERSHSTVDERLRELCRSVLSRLPWRSLLRPASSRCCPSTERAF